MSFPSRSYARDTLGVSEIFGSGGLMQTAFSIRTMDVRARFRMQFSSRPDVHCFVAVE